MMTGEEYIASLNDGRATYFEGRRIDNIMSDPILAESARLIAKGYDRMYRPGPDARSPLMGIPRSAADLKARLDVVSAADIVANTTNQSIMTLITAAGRIGAEHPEYAARIQRWCADAEKRDIRITECITDGKGDRSLHPGDQADKDAYTRVVERRKDGVVIRGAKLHITGASHGHELMVIPTKSMRKGEEDYAIACCIPVNAPGVRIVNTSYAPRHEDDRVFPVSRQNHMPEGFVIFDDVFVPEENIFLNGETRHAGQFAHSLGLWERLGGLTFMSNEADELVGFAQLIAEANGLDKVSHVREKISEMLIHATLIRGALEAAIANCEFGDNGAAFPSELYINAGKYQAATQYNLMCRHLHDIAGGSVLTAPSIADLENNEVGPLVRKYMTANPKVDGEYRIKLFHAIRDVTADAMGGWRFVTNIQAGGGLYAQRIVTRKHYDMEGAKRKALHAAKMLHDEAAE